MISQSTGSEEVLLTYLINSSSLTLVYLDFKWDHLASSSVSELYCTEKHFLYQYQVWWPLEWHQVGIRQGKSSNSTFCSRTWYEQFLIIAISILHHSLYTHHTSPSPAITSSLNQRALRESVSHLQASVIVFCGRGVGHLFYTLFNGELLELWAFTTGRFGNTLQDPFCSTTAKERLFISLCSVQR